MGEVKEKLLHRLIPRWSKSSTRDAREVQDAEAELTSSATTLRTESLAQSSTGLSQKSSLSSRAEDASHDEIYGIKVLYHCTDATVDICFVHGLTGGRESTWTAPGETKSWPEALLPNTLSKSRIITYGYHAYVVGRSAVGSNRLEDHARNFLGALSKDRKDCGATNRPIIFVAHSLGGLVCKVVLLRSQNNPDHHLRSIFHAVKAIAFLGTPHQGSWIADWARIPASCLGLIKSTNRSLLKVLQTDDSHLRSIQTQFASMLREQRESGRALEVTCFYEALPVSMGKLVVPESSATLDGYNAMGIHADHRSMARFKSMDQDGYKMVLEELQRWKDEVRENKMQLQYSLNDTDRRCLESLRLTDPRHDKTRIEQTKGGLLSDSYRWILRNPQFCAWRDDDETRLLWIKGDPGKGKTMLMCGIISELEASSTAEQPVSYFFFQAADSRINTSTAFLRGLLYHLVDRYPRLITYARAEYDRGGPHVFEDVNSWVVLMDVFANMMNDPVLETIYLVVDALDECMEGLSQLIDMLCGSISTSSRMKWVVSSRNLPEIEDRLNEVTSRINQRLSLELNASSVADAVHAYIRHKVDLLAKVKNYDERTKDAVERYLRTNAEGTFLWVALVCQNLEKYRRWDTVPNMATFPAGLGDLYERMVQQIYLDDGDGICNQVLATCTAAQQPLCLAELVVLAAIPSHISEHEESLEEVISLCGSFLVLRGHTVYFVHQSAKEYLLNHETSKLIFPDGLARFHRAIFSRSLTVMHRILHRDMYNLCSLGIGIDDIEVPDPDPLHGSRYLCVHWVDHLCNADLTGNAEPVRTELLKFFSKKFLYWLEALSLLRNVPQGVAAMSRLVHGFDLGVGQTLYDSITDAYRFILAHSWLVESHPLQTYASALLFSPTKSPTRQLFMREKPVWASKFVSAETSWGPCLQVLHGHQMAVQAVVCSPSGDLIASASWDQTIRIWDSSTGRCLARLSKNSQGEGLPPTFHPRLAFSPDGKYLASTTFGGYILIWSTSTWLPVREIGDEKGRHRILLYRDPEDLGTSLAFLPNSQEIIVTGNEVAIYDVATGNCRLTNYAHLPAHHTIGHFSFSPDGLFCAYAMTDGSIWICHMATGVEVTTLRYFAEELADGSDLPSSLIFSADGKRLASGSRNGVLRMWDTSCWKCEVDVVDEGRVATIAISPDNTLLCTASGVWNRTIRVWDAANPTTKPSRVLDGHSQGTTALSFSVDGRRLISGGGDSNVFVWDTKLMAAVPMAATEPPANIDLPRSDPTCFSSDGKHLASGNRDGLIRLWDTAAPNVASTIRKDFADVTAMAFSENSEYLALGSADGRVGIIDVATFRWHRLLPTHCSDPITSVGFSRQGNILATECRTQARVDTWNIDVSEVVLLQSIRSERGGSTCNTFAFSEPSGEHISTVDDGDLNIWETQSGRHLRTLVVTSFEISWFSFSADSRSHLASADWVFIRVWDTTSGNCIYVIHLDREPDYLQFYSTSPSLTIFTRYGTIKIDSPVLSGSCSPREHKVTWQRGYLGEGCDAFPPVEWIKLDKEPLLWLPPTYRQVLIPQSGPLAVSGELLALGGRQGQQFAFIHVDVERLPYPT